jgi:hypothetical protein
MLSASGGHRSVGLEPRRVETIGAHTRADQLSHLTQLIADRIRRNPTSATFGLNVDAEAEGGTDET